MATEPEQKQKAASKPASTQDGSNDNPPTSKTPSESSSAAESVNQQPPTSVPAVAVITQATSQPSEANTQPSPASTLEDPGKPPVSPKPSTTPTLAPKSPLAPLPALSGVKPSLDATATATAAAAKAAPILCINPNKAVFSTAGGVSKHLMINKTNERLAIKIRSSNNFFFRVNPVYSFLDCNAVNELEVIRLAGGGAKQDKLQIIYVVCSETDTDATKLFGLRAKVRSVILPITTNP